MIHLNITLRHNYEYYVIMNQHIIKNIEMMQNYRFLIMDVEHMSRTANI